MSDWISVPCFVCRVLMSLKDVCTNLEPKAGVKMLNPVPRCDLKLTFCQRHRRRESLVAVHQAPATKAAAFALLVAWQLFASE